MRQIGRKKVEDREIGNRAAQEIRAYADARDIGYEDTMRIMGIDHSSLYAWGGRRSNPSASALAKMALHGFDTFYILTGVRQ